MNEGGPANWQRSTQGRTRARRRPAVNSTTWLSPSLRFTRATPASAVILAVALCLSVCLSDRLLQVGVLLKRITQTTSRL